MSTRDQRVTLALKWRYLDHLELDEIVDRFEEAGYGSYAKSTIKDYLSEKPSEEVEAMIEKQHANTRLQIAEREERKWKRAREAESQATIDEPVWSVRPVSASNDTDHDIPVQDWRIIAPDDDAHPEWATERDVVIEFTDDTRYIPPGQKYYVADPSGEPEYTKVLVGLERDQPNLKGQAAARQEQSNHLRAKGDAMGVYSKDINLDADVNSTQTVEFDDETAESIREAVLNDE